MSSALPAVSTKAYHLANKGPQVVLLHGLTGSPYDLRPLADVLHRSGCEVHVPLLRGHGTSVRDLAAVGFNDWLNQIRELLAHLDPKRPLILGGLSMGALAALVLSHEQKNLDALLLLAPALLLDIKAELTISLANIKFLPPTMNFRKLSGGSDILDPEAKKKCPSYPQMSVFGLMQLDHLRLLALDEISGIRTPTFLAFGALDEAIDAKGSWRLFTARCHSPLFSKFYARSKHIISLDYDRDELGHDVLHFLNHHIGLTS